MNRKRPQILLAAALVASLTLAATASGAGEIGHFAPGLANIRDYAVPEPGFYGALYNYVYSTERLNDRNGDKLSSVTVGPGPGLTLGIDLNVDVYALAPTFIWVSDWKIAGAKVAGFITPTFANSSVSAALSAASGSAREADTSQFAVGDMFVQPIWLGWTYTNWDFALAYGFYAPIGKYDTETLTLPVVGTITAEAADNVGFGFWTHQIQGSTSWYPWDDKRMAVSGVLTWEIPGDKEGFKLTPGHVLTFNWGVSQYLPLKQDQSLLLELGVAGYGSWQISDDSGSAARNPDVHDQVHAIGGQLGLTYVPWALLVNAHYFYELSSEDRFEGESFGLNITKMF